MTPNLGKRRDLDSWWIHHDSHSSSHSLRRKVLDELGANGSGVAVSSSHLAPDDAELRLLRLVGNWSLIFGPVNVSTLLADVPRGLILLGAALNLEESGVVFLVRQTALEASEDSLGVQSAWWRSHFCVWKFEDSCKRWRILELTLKTIKYFGPLITSKYWNYLNT